MRDNAIDTVYGIRAVMEAIHSGKEIDKIIMKKGLTGELSQELVDLMRSRGLAPQLVPAEKFLQYGNKNHQGVVALLSPVDFEPLEEVIARIWEKGESPFIVMVDSVTDVRNFGAIVRTAECAGAHAVVFPIKGSARISSDAVKTSAGALLHMPICRVASLKSAVSYLKLSGIRVVAATEKNQNIYSKSNLKPPIAIIMGSEDKGISDSVLKAADELVSIPIHGKVDSLNVSVAAGVMMYEVIRQNDL
ncbi:MAG: 23S rRNA (guanosine(2251)-2'-O)-methyltransferase RlmB [Bacteroidales bacterium]|nr:23S rRNA (guanosine(2251)-2'-O)-methyltransferase RlmB [Bacteroidales bacterium]